MATNRYSSSLEKVACGAFCALPSLDGTLRADLRSSKRAPARLSDQLRFRWQKAWFLPAALSQEPVGMVKKFSQRAEDLRRALAQEAARIMAEHGIEDFLQAKRKAADRLGVNDVAGLPKNIEIEAALRAHQRLFGRDSHDP